MNKILIISLIAFTAAFGADNPPEKDVPLPAPVVAADNALLAAAAKAHAVYIKAIDAEIKKEIVILEKAKADATRSNNLELALAIKAKIDGLTIEAVTAKMNVKVDMMDDRPASPVGTYKVVAGGWSGIKTVTLDDKKAVTTSNKLDYGTWILNAKTGILTITWYNGEVNSGKLTNSDMELVRASGNGSITLLKVQ